MKKIDSLPNSSGLRAAHLIERLGRLLRAGDHAAGLNPAQAEALRYLARANRFSRTPAALAEYLGSTRGTVSQTLLALEAKGMIERKANARDGRSIMLEVTPSGMEFIGDDPVRMLSRTIDAGGAASRLADDLEAGLRAFLVERGGRAFGACHTCRHFRLNQRSGNQPHHCALLDEPLREGDKMMICLEQSDA
ncbi:MAG: MarR family transcriptional regulator [Hyphomonadaceae bacterium BRH_c29]|nr:MAG: MarR family transcriptional regulator [Hyphomonadaceae bacterium BRH_c29]HRK67172.1 MarR family transcriptional regulator [Hyphomonas sp.]